MNKFLTSKIANKGVQKVRRTGEYEMGTEEENADSIVPSPRSFSWQVHEYLLNQAALTKASLAAYIYDWLIEDSDVDDRYLNKGLTLLQELNIVNQQRKNFVSNATVVDEELRQRWLELF